MLRDARLVVVKVGSALLVDQHTGALRDAWLSALAEDVADMRKSGQSVVIVSSGAIALGRADVGLPPGNLALEQAQAAAAVGQTHLVGAWGAAFQAHGLLAAQILLTLEDTQKRRRYLNGRSTLASLLQLGAVPVVNENDTVATDEIRYGDNDRLAAGVALMVGADLLVLLSDVDGLYTGDPRHDPAAAHIPDIARVTPEIEAMAGGTGSAGASGGMRTKVLAAKTATQGGCTMVVTKGDVAHPLHRLSAGAPATWFRPTATRAQARKNWIGAMKPVGQILIDAGAVVALRRGKSLLPAGVSGIRGAFHRGDPVTIAGPDGGAIATGLAGYGADEARNIQGMQSDRISAILGYPGRSAMIHADDIVIWGGKDGPAH